MGDYIRPVHGMAYDDAKSSSAPGLSTARRSVAAPDLIIVDAGMSQKIELARFVCHLLAGQCITHACIIVQYNLN